VATISFLLLFIALFIGIPVPFAFFASIIFLVISRGYDPSFLLPYSYGKMSALVLLAIPLFIIAGGLIEKGKIGEKLIDLVDMIVGKIRGGLGVVMVVSCAIFGSVTGSAAATETVIGTIMLPRLEQAGYPKSWSASLLASSSVLGMLIPPSSIMILYAWVGNQSVLACFLSSIIPGIIMAVLLSFINILWLRNNKNIKIEKNIRSNNLIKEYAKKIYIAFPALLMPVIILGGIYGGIMTPTEAAAIAVLYAIPVGLFIYKGLNARIIFNSVISSANNTGIIMVMLFSIMMLSRLYIMEDLPGTIMSFFESISSNKYIILIMVNFFLIIIGMLMDDVSAVLLATPLFIPIILQLGVNPIQFAAIIGVNLGLGNITPPCAPLLYLSVGLAETSANEVFYPTFIMIIFAWIPTLLLTTYVPQLSLFLPRLLLGIGG